MKEAHQKIAIIGAGPAGLGIAGCLSKEHIPFDIYEQSENIGHSWRNHYDRLHLHTVRSLSHLPHLPMPKDYPQYASRQQVVDYLEMYADHFKITPQLDAKVTQVTREGAGWKIEFEDRPPVRTDRVIIATGTNRLPKIPAWPGMDAYRGLVLHSKHYRNPGDTKGEKVLVIGMGNTGAELALDLAEHEKETYLSVRSPVNILPRDINGRPTQLTGKLLEKLPFNIGEWVGNVVRNITVGNLEKYGLPQSTVPPARQLKMTGKTPVLDIGTVQFIKEGKIRVLPGITGFYPEGVMISGGARIPVDSVILATGYKPALDEFLDTSKGLLDDNGVPKSPIGTGPYAGLYFIGFDNYKLGGILGTIRTDAELIMRDMREDLGI